MTQVLDPRQSLTISFYKDPLSGTFGNLKGSMIKAGYDEAYANSISGRNPEWLTENISSDVKLIQKAESNLNRIVNVVIDYGGKVNVDVAKLQVDVSKFILKNLARKKYSEDENVTPPQVQINIVNYHKDKKDPVTVKDVEAK